MVVFLIVPEPFLVSCEETLSVLIKPDPLMLSAEDSRTDED